MACDVWCCNCRRSQCCLREQLCTVQTCMSVSTPVRIGTVRELVMVKLKVDHIKLCRFGECIAMLSGCITGDATIKFPARSLVASWGVQQVSYIGCMFSCVRACKCIRLRAIGRARVRGANVCVRSCVSGGRAGARHFCCVHADGGMLGWAVCSCVAMCVCVA